MFSEILKIIPKLDEKDLRKMEQQLSSRLKKIAKGFGQGLTNVLKAGGIAGLAIGLIDKILNPLKEVQEAIDRMLGSSDDLATNAKQFNTSTGKLFKLSQLAQATGLDQEQLFMLLTKYQTAVAEAQANPNDPSAVKNYVGQQDTVEGFFQFIQALQRMDKNQQVLVQQQVFGEKQILKMADFLQQDFGQLMKATGLDKINSARLGAPIDKMGNLKDLADVLAVRRNVQDTMVKGSIINEGMIRARDKAERVALERENQKIKSYESIASISEAVDGIMKLIEGGIAMIGDLIAFLKPSVMKIISFIEGAMKSPWFRGIFNSKGKGE